MGASLPNHHKTRLDVVLVERRLCATRAKARDAVIRGLVTIDGRPARKPGLLVAAEATLQVAEDAHPYVSRGGLKLAHALDVFSVDPAGSTAIDLGASTGGFTDVLLQRGAERVFAVDVGTGQLDAALREDGRVAVLEKVNARDLTRDHVPQDFDLIVCDVSFISLRLALSAVLDMARPGTRLIALIKPQFEAGRDKVGKGGIVRDEAVHRMVCDDVAAWMNARGWPVQGIDRSPVEGPDGNREFLVSAIKRSVSDVD